MWVAVGVVVEREVVAKEVAARVEREGAMAGHDSQERMAEVEKEAAATATARVATEAEEVTGRGSSAAAVRAAAEKAAVEEEEAWRAEVVMEAAEAVAAATAGNLRW